MFYQTVMASVLFLALVCWGDKTRKRDAGQLDRLVRKTDHVVVIELELLTSVAEKRALNRLKSIMDNDCHSCL